MSLEEYMGRLAKSFEFERFIVVGKMDYVDLQIMVLPENLRGCGRGTAFMKLVCEEADRLGEVIGTCPEPLIPHWTEADKERLIAWYKQFGFIPSPDEDKYRVSHVRLPLQAGKVQRGS